MKANPAIFIGLFFTTLATLLYELLLVRVFSVTLWYHFAFMAVSIAMFGMTVGALLVYLSKAFTEGKVSKHITNASFLFALTMLVSFWVHLQLRVIPYPSLIGFLTMFVTYVLISVPFIFGGITVCLCLTRFKEQVGKLYAIDLIGAAGGCLLLAPVLETFGVTSSVILLSLIAMIGALSFSLADKANKTTTLCAVAVIAFIALLGLDSQNHFMKLNWVKGFPDPPAAYEKWNVLSRLRVFGDKNKDAWPRAWGLSHTLPEDFRVKELGLNIDNSAFTVLTAYDGDAEKVKHLKYDIINLGHYLRHNADVAVIGVGGGRDVLSALIFNQKSVTGMEINQGIIDVLSRQFNDFTGNIHADPKVKIVNSEARSYLASNKQLYDLIQISLIDTWAATTIGAHVLTENNLYTAEAWKIFFNRLKPNGIITCSRWSAPKSPAEVYRLLNIAAHTLREEKVKDPLAHIILAESLPDIKNPELERVGTLIVSKAPFNKDELAQFEAICKSMQFQVLLDNNICQSPILKAIVEQGNDQSFLDSLPYNIAPPTDDSPFFFQMVRMKDWLKWSNFTEVGHFNMIGTFTLVFLLIIVSLLTLSCIILPLFWKGKIESKGAVWPYFIFFSCIGMGFMFIEVSQLQRFSVLLGHPSYSLSVVLFTLLLATGIGSYIADKLQKQEKLWIWMITLIVVLSTFGLLSAYIAQAFQEQSLTYRILMAVAVLFPLGLVLGTAFPLGMRLALRQCSSITPWLWGLNGATSVFASVLEVIIAQTAGISFAYWLGVLFYFVGALVLATTYKSEAG
jgi:hypothetical protein